MQYTCVIQYVESVPVSVDIMVNPHIYTVIMGRLSRLDIAISNRLTTHDYILSRQPTQKSPVIHTLIIYVMYSKMNCN